MTYRNLQDTHKFTGHFGGTLNKESEIIHEENKENEIVQYSNKIYRALEKIYKESGPKPIGVNLSMSEQHLVALINELQRKISKMSVLSILLFNIHRHIMRIKRDLLLILKETEIPILLTKNNFDMIFEVNCKAERRGSDSDLSEINRNKIYRPKTVEKKGIIPTKIIVRTIGENTYAIQIPIIFRQKYWKFIEKLCDAYSELLNHIKGIESVGTYVINMSGIRNPKNAKSYSIHKTMFYQYIIKDPVLKVLIYFMLGNNKKCEVTNK